MMLHEHEVTTSFDYIHSLAGNRELSTNAGNQQLAKYMYSMICIYGKPLHWHCLLFTRLGGVGAINSLCKSTDHRT